MGLMEVGYVVIYMSVVVAGGLTKFFYLLEIASCNPVYLGRALTIESEDRCARGDISGVQLVLFFPQCLV